MQDHTSNTQKRIYDFIVEYIREEGVPPTNREIGSALNIPSPGHVDYHLSQLEKMGLIARESKRSRGIKLKQRLWGIQIMGSISTDEPIEIFTEPVEPLEVGRELEQQGAYALVVKGQSMTEDHICDKDYVIMKPQATCENGDIVVAVHMQGNGKAVLKRFFHIDEKIYLQPANSELAPICIPISQWQTEWQVQGKVIAVFRKELATKSEKISAILSALKAGAKVSIVENNGDVQDEGNNAYDTLTQLIKSKLADKPGSDLLVDNYRNQPASWRERLLNELAQADVDQDKEILNAASKVTSQVIQANVVYDRIVTANNTMQAHLDQIVEQCRKEAKQWFRYSLGAAILGFLVILGGVVLAIFTVNVSLGFLTSLASLVPNVASLLFFQQRNKANERLDFYYKDIVNRASVYKATELTLTTSNESQDHYKGLIIKKWLDSP